MLTYSGFGGSTKPIKINPQGCDIITIMNVAGGDDIIVKQNSTALLPPKAFAKVAKKSSNKKPFDACAIYRFIKRSAR